MDEVIAALSPLAGKRVVDGTFGAGGYSRALLAAGARVIAIDRDPSVEPFADALAAEFGTRFSFAPGTFSQLDSLAAEHGPIDAVVLDIGVSSMQLDQAERGFSFMRDGPLDMRMSAAGESAADLVNRLDAEPLANLLYAFGEERKSRRIAQFIVGDAHPATRSFQALRIAVNAEFDQLVEALFAAERLLPEGGRMLVVTFHSLEDRIVKRFFDPDKGGPNQSRHLPQVATEARRWIDVAKARKAGEAELGRNPRARSAMLRVATRSEATVRPVSFDGLGVPQIRGEA
ncbi:MAG: 16S rRNA (cytosine(1402)-N(4))-methyltransferase [Rhizobiales bacterium 32-66-8]|nr:MAG: 16S rRNA (cytosine(1402)-N(4))-methyltransferase [Rhizobiales bacterium 32-66-8]